jgi:heme exporter protein B
MPGRPERNERPLNMGNAFFTLLQRDLRLAWLSRADAVTSLVFFLVVASMFPLAVGAEQKLLRDIGPGVVWVSALLASLLSLPRLFTADHADGTLEQLLLTPQPLAVLALAKVLAHWLTTGLPLVLLSPLLGVQYGLASPDIALLLVTLLLGTPTLSLLGAVGAALTLGLRGAAVLSALLILPLNVPVLIFGAGAVAAQAAGLDVSAQLSLLGALLTLTLAAAPWAVAAALRVACE